MRIAHSIIFYKLKTFMKLQTLLHLLNIEWIMMEEGKIIFEEI